MAHLCVIFALQAPLWLVFENYDPLGDVIIAIYKAGDDLRQDIATIGLIRAMSDVSLTQQFLAYRVVSRTHLPVPSLQLHLQLWNGAGLSLPTQCYLVVGTGNESGMIEVVRDSKTLSSIQAVRGCTFRV